MSDTVISVENLGKKYIIGHEKQERYTALRDVIANGAKGLLKPFRRGKSPGIDPRTEEFWALKDVSFEIKQGDRVGIIGRNGAGKSTLLKILSRITEPTEGRIKIKGRVASLLEVGTGFHPELTGRENIFLNGAILGMGKAEIARKFDEIVAFAEVEKFLDTPVKRYSSGMYVRLAFAVAAHLEPEILIVDEVLAVGDAQFQQKCLGKMEDVGKEGRTVLFVSHNMGLIQQLCSKGFYLDQGKIVAGGSAESTINLYLKNNIFNSQAHISWEEWDDAPGNDYVRIKDIKICGNNGIVNEAFLEDDLQVEIIYQNRKQGSILNPAIGIFNSLGTHVFSSMPTQDDWYMKPHPEGLYKSICHIQGNLLNEDNYSLLVILVENGNQPLVTLDNILSIKMIDSGTNRGKYFGAWKGTVRPLLKWETEQTILGLVQ
jgi:lipopolysaccharide transport system ATP-binding protein